MNGERRAQRQVFRALLGVDKSVIERVDVEDGGDVLVVHARPARAARGRYGSAAGGAEAMTRVRVGDAGGRWTRARRG